MTSNIVEGLNPRQREAVETVEGPLLIIAGPGSGKTRVITHRAAYLVRVCGVAPQRIAAVTFTNKAAREMRQRLGPLLGPAAQHLTAGTFHAFCAMVLRRDGQRLGLSPDFAIYDDSDQMALLKRAMSDVNVDPRRFAPRAIQSAISGAKSQLLTVEGLGLKRENYFDEIVYRVYDQYDHLLAQASAVDFDDLLLKTYLLFQSFPEVASKYQDRYVHFMIDEFQDTNVAQYAIARQLAQKYRNLCVVGDPDQSIYSWRHADIRNILSFQSDYPDAKVITLDQNYRSTRTILAAAQDLIAPNRQRVEKRLWTQNGQGVPIVVAEGYNEEEEAQFVVKEVLRLVRSEGYALGDIAVMYRVNAQSRALEEACLRYGVAYQVVGGIKFYQRQEVKDLVAYLRLVSNPHDDVSLTRVINIPPRGIGQRTLDELTRMARASGMSMYAAIEAIAEGKADGRQHSGVMAPRSAQALVRFRDLIKGLMEESQGVDLLELIDSVAERTGYKRHVLEEMEQGEERWENILEFRSAARDYVSLGARAGLAAFLESVSLVSDVDSYEQKVDALTLITLHQAKRLEFPVVFIVGMEEGLLPHIRSMDDSGGVEEERRLCYVGVTRAKERLYLVRAFRRGFRGGSEPCEPSRFLADIPLELITSPDALNDRSRPSAKRGPGARQPAPAPAQRPASPSPVRYASAPAPRRQPPDVKLEVAAGDKVRHPVFGEGIVMSCTPSGGDFEVVVAFKENHGIKRLLYSFAKLEKL